MCFRNGAGQTHERKSPVGRSEVGFPIVGATNRESELVKEKVRKMGPFGRLSCPKRGDLLPRQMLGNAIKATIIANIYIF